LDALLKVTDVPWLDPGWQIITARDGLKKTLKELLPTIGGSDTKVKIKEVIPYPDALAKINSPKLHDLLDQLKLTKTSQLVLLESRMGIVVRVDDGKARVVGLFEAP
jgi:hypothetical protein